MRHSELIENGNTQVSRSIVVVAEPICRTRLAVAHTCPAVCERLDEVARFLRKRMIVAVAGSIQPPDLSMRRSGSQGVEHREHGSRSYASAEQHHGPVARSQRERPPWRGDFQTVADANLITQECAPETVS